jgi:hypothetical protein
VALLIAHGARLWSTVMWGTNRDLKLLGNTEKRFPSLTNFVDEKKLRLSEGPQLRDGAAHEEVSAAPELIGKAELDMDVLKSVGRIHVFPRESLVARVSAARAFVRVRAGVRRPIEVCRPPHVIVNASRTFAVYSDDFIVVPPRQIGIAGDREQSDLLRALALYLSSDFVDYHRFLDSSQVSVRGVSTIASLRRLPMPLGGLGSATIKKWASLHRRLTGASERFRAPILASAPDGDDLGGLTREMNALVYDALQLTEAERWIVHDLVHVRMQLADGQVRPAATEPPNDAELLAYAAALRTELDAFLDSYELAHQIDVIRTSNASAVRIALVATSRIAPNRLLRAGDAEATAIERARRRIEDSRSQWRYFDRNLVVYERNATVIMKPAQRVWWTRSQALADADELIADALRKVEPA